MGGVGENCRALLQALSSGQALHQSSEEPTERFVEFLSAAISIPHARAEGVGVGPLEGHDDVPEPTPIRDCVIESLVPAGMMLGMSTDELRDAALTLPAKERAKLAHDLLRSLDGPPDPEVDAAWIEELERRARELADGSVEAVDWEEARDRIARRLRERRR